MVAPRDAAPSVWAGNEAWPGCGAFTEEDTNCTRHTYNSDSEDDASVELDPEDQLRRQKELDGPGDNSRRQETWGQLRIISGVTRNLKLASPKPNDNCEDDVLTPRSTAIRRVLGESVAAHIHAGSGVKRIEAFELAQTHIQGVTLSQSGTAMMDPRLRLEPVSRALYSKVLFDVAIRALSDPVETIRDFAVSFIRTCLESLRQHTFHEELVPLTREVVATCVACANKNDKPGQIERNEQVLELLIAEPRIGIRGVTCELYQYVTTPDRISGSATHDWLLVLISRLVSEHKIQPAGEIPLDPTVAYALKFLTASCSPARQQLAMDLIMQLYHTAGKRLQHLIASVQPGLHRKLTDAFTLVDGQARGQARKRRVPGSRGSRRPSRASTAQSRMSFLKGGERVAPLQLPPVLMNTALLLKSVKQRRGKMESEDELLMRVTHLHCNGKGIANIDCLEQTRRVQVIYLNDNYIPRIDNLTWLKSSLTHLYLQNNQIYEMDGLDQLSCLTKLYLDKNRISMVRGLEGCARLEELHLNDQHLEPGQQMEFSHDSMVAIGRSLRVLNAANNCVAEVDALGHLQRLDSLDLCGSLVNSVPAVNFLTSHCPFMRSLNMLESPVVGNRTHCEEILAHGEYLEEFNGKPVTERERQFLRRLAERKSQKAKAIIHGRRQSMSAGSRLPLQTVVGNGRRGSTGW
eukprot:TRINITY_DN202_c0_g1_i1.p1 TRINITY_DN202_c0_g1~~TRINITY_DN202_c0_g1_i1.p1  ORF type:complete len:691 (+),score=139.08 TRINITY_DN202_c0_g1_i1:61-2133(+)